MRAITQLERQMRSTNCGGPNELFDVQRFEIEEEDVGRTSQHYLGYNAKEYRFDRIDIGKVIEVVTQRSYHSWGFCNPIN